MNIFSVTILILLAVWAVWNYALYFHVHKYKLPNDFSNKFFWTFVVLEMLLSLVFIYFYAGIDWSIL